jgi:hypothetical protein
MPFRLKSPAKLRIHSVHSGGRPRLRRWRDKRLLNAEFAETHRRVRREEFTFFDSVDRSLVLHFFLQQR